MADLENTSTETVEATGAEETKDTITMTQSELDALLQKAGDKRVSQAMKTMEKKQREAEKLRGMNEEDQREYNLSQRERAVEEKELELARLENKSEGLSILSEKGLDSKFIDIVLDDDADVMYDRIKLIEKAFKQSVKQEVEKRLGSESPRKNLPTDNVVTKDNINKMGYQDLVKFKNEQPELWAELMK